MLEEKVQHFSERKTYLYNWRIRFTNSLPSKTLTAYEVDFLVFSGTALSTSRFISSSHGSESKPFCHPNINFNVRLESLNSVLKIGECHWGISSDIPQF